tara:strand:- start:72 stop:599 length:528 start_codon:yes stop_codon:yes gene_type:complete
MRTWKKNLSWASLFDRQVKMAIGPHLISKAALEEDVTRATDFVLSTDRVRIACRMRRWSKVTFERFGDQFTVRSHLASGAKTELAKILDGWGDMMFYGWGDPETLRLREWHLLDLNVFREWFFYSKQNSIPISAGQVRNNDGSTGEAFFIPDLPEGGVIGCGVGLQLRETSLLNA